MFQANVIGRVAPHDITATISQESLVKYRIRFLSALREIGVKDALIARNRLDALFDGMAVEGASKALLGTQADEVEDKQQGTAVEENRRANVLKSLDRLIQAASLYRWEWPGRDAERGLLTPRAAGPQAGSAPDHRRDAAAAPRAGSPQPDEGGGFPRAGC